MFLLFCQTAFLQICDFTILQHLETNKIVFSLKIVNTLLSNISLCVRVCLNFEWISLLNENFSFVEVGGRWWLHVCDDKKDADPGLRIYLMKMNDPPTPAESDAGCPGELRRSQSKLDFSVARERSFIRQHQQVDNFTYDI